MLSRCCKAGAARTYRWTQQHITKRLTMSKPTCSRKQLWCARKMNAGWWRTCRISPCLWEVLLVPGHGQKYVVQHGHQQLTVGHLADKYPTSCIQPVPNWPAASDLLTGWDPADKEWHFIVQQCYKHPTTVRTILNRLSERTSSLSNLAATYLLPNLCAVASGQDVQVRQQSTGFQYSVIPTLLPVTSK